MSRVTIESPRELGRIGKARLRNEGMSQRAFAQLHGVTDARVSQVLNGVGPPPDWFLAWLGAEKRVVYTMCVPDSPPLLRRKHWKRLYERKQ